MNEHKKRILELPRVKRLLELIGLVTVTWNSIETLWYLVYTSLMNEAPRNKVDQIYKQFGTGAAQRKMILSLAETTFGKSSEIYKEIKMLCDKTSELSQLRNSMTHGVFMFDHLNGEPGLRIAPMGSINRRENRLSEVGTELVEELVHVYDRMDIHEQEMEDLRIILMQEYSPNKMDNRPLSKEELERLPQVFRENLPRQKRERVAPDRLKNDD